MAPEKDVTRKHIWIALGLVAVVVAASYLLWQTLPVAPISEIPGTGQENTTPQHATTEVVAKNLDTPWSMAFVDEDIMLFSERGGVIKRLNPANGQVDTIDQLPVAAVGEGGFLGIALDPDFTENNLLYAYYTYRQSDNLANKVVRFELNNNQLDKETTLLDKIPASSIHNGGRLAFGPDGKLYITAGDASQSELAQDKNSLAGKILRINPDGSIPADNPFDDSPVYSYGHRNPQGLAWNPDGTLYSTEHGPKGHDEVNKIETGANYGWPDVKGKVELSPRSDASVANYRNPLAESGLNTWAPSGVAYYANDDLGEEFQNKLLFAGLRSQSLWRLDPTTQEIEKLYEDKFGRLRDVAVGLEGNLYFTTSNRDGRGSPINTDDRIVQITAQ